MRSHRPLLPLLLGLATLLAPLAALTPLSAWADRPKERGGLETRRRTADRETDDERVGRPKTSARSGRPKASGGGGARKPHEKQASSKPEDKRDRASPEGKASTSSNRAGSPSTRRAGSDERRGSSKKDDGPRASSRNESTSRRGSDGGGDRYIYGTVRKGDSFESFAKRNAARAADVRKLNKLFRARRPEPGARLKIAEKSFVVAAPIERRGRPASTDGDYVVYKVKKGDSLRAIADRFDVRASDLVKLNRLGRRAKPKPGTVLKIKRRPDQVLVGGVTLPADDRLYLRTRPDASWGTPGTVRLIRQVYGDFMSLHPYSVKGVVADISRSGGGYFPPHKSHRRGVDIDVGYFKIGNEALRYLEVVTPETIDIHKTWDLIRLFVNTGRVTAIFMDHKLQGALHAHLTRLGYDKDLLEVLLQYPLPIGEGGGIIRHSPGHHHHLHVRFNCVDPLDPCAADAVALIPAPSGGTVAGRVAPGDGTSIASKLRTRARLHVVEGDEDEDSIAPSGVVEDYDPDGGSAYSPQGETWEDAEGEQQYRGTLDGASDSVWVDPETDRPAGMDESAPSQGRIAPRREIILCPRSDEPPSAMSRFGCEEGP